MVDIDAVGFFRSLGRARELLRAKRGDGLQECPAMELHNVFRFYINRSGGRRYRLPTLDKENTWQAKAPAPPCWP